MNVNHFRYGSCAMKFFMPECLLNLYLSTKNTIFATDKKDDVEHQNTPANGKILQYR